MGALSSRIAAAQAQNNTRQDGLTQAGAIENSKFQAQWEPKLCSRQQAALMMATIKEGAAQGWTSEQMSAYFVNLCESHGCSL